MNPPYSDSACVFCNLDKIANPVERWVASVHGIVCFVFEPLNPVVPGHLLVVPEKHVENATVSPCTAAGAMELAAMVATRYSSANIITSIGAPATQSVMHLHLHVVPRQENDGLHLPWTNQTANR